MQSFLEYASSVNNAPCLANLCDVLAKADTLYRRSITEREIDNGVDALKDSIHSKMTLSDGYANDWLRETDKNLVTIMAEEAKKWAKDFLRARDLLVING